jgi:hypothetical protein
MAPICNFCGKPVSKTNYQKILQTRFVSLDESKIVQTRVVEDKPIFIHSICGLPEEVAPPTNKVSERDQPTRALYVDIGDLSPAHVSGYLSKCLDTFKEVRPGIDCLIVPYRTRQ